MPIRGTVHNDDDGPCEPSLETLRRWRESYPTRDEWWSLLQNGYEPDEQVIHNVIRSVGDVG